MVRVLDSQRRGAESGKATSLVVFLHGYGADGADLMGLAEPLAPHLPDTVFLAPDAPEVCIGNPLGFQWFPIPWLDGSSEEAAAEGMEASVADLDAFLDELLREERIPPEKLAIVGFSQGTMMALHVAPRRKQVLAGVVGFSGRLIRPEILMDEVESRPPVLLLHGDRDDVVPPAHLPEAADALSGAGFEVLAQYMSGMGHGISEDGLRLALFFLREKLGYES